MKFHPDLLSTILIKDVQTFKHGTSYLVHATQGFPRFIMSSVVQTFEPKSCLLPGSLVGPPLDIGGC